MADRKNQFCCIMAQLILVVVIDQLMKNVIYLKFSFLKYVLYLLRLSYFVKALLEYKVKLRFSVLTLYFLAFILRKKEV